MPESESSPTAALTGTRPSLPEALMDFVPKPALGVACISLPEDGTACRAVLKIETGHVYLPLTPKERFLWEHIDGDSMLSEIAGYYYTEFGAFDLESINEFCRKLGRAGFLANWVGPQTEQHPVSTARWSQALKQVPLGPTVGDRLFASLSGLAGSAFAGKKAQAVFAAVGAVLIVYFFWVLTVDDAFGAQEIFRLQGSYALGFAAWYGWNFVGSVLHALARAAGLKTAGREVIGAGFVLRFGLLQAFVDDRDMQTARRSERERILLAGMALELLAAGLLGLAATLVVEVPPFRDLLVIGAIALMSRLFAQLCPFADSPIYRAATESLQMPRLRREALWYLRPAHWLELWNRNNFDRREQTLLVFGLLCVIWVTAGAKLFSFFLRTQLSITIVELRHAFLAGGGALTADLVIAALIMLVVTAPIVAFLFLSALYVSHSALRLLPAMKAWERPLPLVGAWSATAAVVGIVCFASNGAWTQPAVWSLALLGVLLLAAHWIRCSWREFSASLASRTFLTFALAGAGVSALATALWTQALTGVVVWPVLFELSAAAVLPATLLAATQWPAFRRGTIAPLWLASWAGLAACSLVQVSVLATWSSEQNDGTLLTAPALAAIAMAAAWLVVGTGCAYWHLLHRQPITVTRYAPAATQTESAYLQSSFEYFLKNFAHNLHLWLGDAAHKLVVHPGGTGLPVQTTPTVIVAEDADRATLAGKLRAVVQATTDQSARVVGVSAVQRLIETIWARLPWEERELAAQDLLRDTSWSGAAGLSHQVPAARRIELLKGTLLFHDFTDDELHCVASIVRPAHYDQGETIIRQGEKGDEAYVIQQGSVAVAIQDEVGTESRIAVLGPGSIVGELALVRHAPRSATVRALEPVDLLVIDRQVFESFVVEQYHGTRDKLNDAISALRRLEKMQLFGEYSAREIADVAAQARPERHDAGACLFDGQPPRFLIIDSGSADVVLRDAASPRTVLRLGPGDHFGEMALLGEDISMLQLRVTQPLTAFALDSSTFAQTVGRHPFSRRRLLRLCRDRVRAVTNALLETRPNELVRPS